MVRLLRTLSAEWLLTPRDAYANAGIEWGMSDDPPISFTELKRPDRE